jgi:hypothetical protein
MDPMFRDMNLHDTQPVPTDFTFPAIRISSSPVYPHKRDRTLFICMDRTDHLELLDRLAKVITGSKIYYHVARVRPTIIDICDDCKWAHEANLALEVNTIDTVLVRHQTDPYSYLVLSNSPYGLRVILYGRWVKSSGEFAYLSNACKKLADSWTADDVH